MIREPHFHQFALAELLPFFEQFPTQYLSGERNIKLAYRHWFSLKVRSEN